MSGRRFGNWSVNWMEAAYKDLQKNPPGPLVTGNMQRSHESLHNKAPNVSIKEEDGNARWGYSQVCSEEVRE